MADSDHRVRIETEPSDGFLLSEKLMLAVVGILAAALVYVIGRHIYDRWYFMRLRRRERVMQRRRPGTRIHNVLFSSTNIVDGGLERLVLSSLPVFVFPGGGEEEPTQGCTVCLSEFEKDDIVRLLPKCNHSFHVDCIDMWFHSHSTCPLCRSRVERVAKPVGSDTAEGSPASPDRFEYYHLELSPCFSRNRLMTLKRILSMNRSKPADGGAAVDLECGELTRDSNHAPPPNGCITNPL